MAGKNGTGASPVKNADTALRTAEAKLDKPEEELELEPLVDKLPAAGFVVSSLLFVLNRFSEKLACVGQDGSVGPPSALKIIERANAYLV